MPTQRNGKVLFDGEEMYDVTKRANSVLEEVLKDPSLVGEVSPEDAVERVDVRLEKTARPVIERDSGRSAARVLFVTEDQSVLTTGSVAQREYVELSAYFDEVHVLVLVGRRGANTNVRCADRAWIYTVHDPYWWSRPFTARDEAAELLVFNDAVRPDVVVATDPFLAGYTAYLIAGAFARPLQVHVYEDFMSSAYRAKSGANRWRARLATYVLKRTGSVRAKTTSILDMLQKRFKKIADVAMLPHFYNFSGYIDAVPAFDVHERYKDFSFIALAFGALTADSPLHDTFAALHQILKNPRIGLIVIGDGPAKKLFLEKVRILGIERSVVFVPAADDLVSYMKTADALVETSGTNESDEGIMRAAAAGLPIIAIRTELRADLLKDGASAFLCEKGDVQCLTQKFTKFLNTPALRQQFGRVSAQTAKERLLEDPSVYYVALRDTIEVILETETEEAPATVHSAAPAPETAVSSGRIVGPDGISYPAVEQEERTA